MNLNQLRAFHKVAEFGSFTAAAVALRVTQPALTNQVKGLERHYEVELFYRRARSIELTPAGRALFGVTEEIFGKVEEAEGVLAQSTGALRGVLRVGADSPYLVVEVMERFQARHPGVLLEVSFGNSATIATGLRSFETDVAFLSQVGEAEHLHAVHRLSDELVAFVNRKHPFATLGSVTMAHFENERMIRREPGSNTQAMFDRACHQSGVSPDYVVQMGSREALREAVALGMGMGIIPLSELGEDHRLVPVRIRGVELACDDYLVCLKTRRNAPLIRAFVESVQVGEDP